MKNVCDAKCVFNLDLFLVPPPEHQNYFGVDDNLGPVAVSIRRERLDDGREKEGMQFNHRVTFRTSQVTLTHGRVLCLLPNVLNQCRAVMDAWRENPA